MDDEDLQKGLDSLRTGKAWDRVQPSLDEDGKERSYFCPEEREIPTAAWTPLRSRGLGESVAQRPGEASLWEGHRDRRQPQAFSKSRPASQARKDKGV